MCFLNYATFEYALLLYFHLFKDPIDWRLPTPTTEMNVTLEIPVLAAKYDFIF